MRMCMYACVYVCVRSYVFVGGCACDVQPEQDVIGGEMSAHFIDLLRRQFVEPAM